MTSLILEPEIYAPIQNHTGDYVDRIPHITDVGIRCPCSLNRRQAPIYKTVSSFMSHTKTQGHAKWLEELNNNRNNFVVENAELKETVRTQKEIIARLELQVVGKDHVIAELLHRVAAPMAPQMAINLLDT